MPHGFRSQALTRLFLPRTLPSRAQLSCREVEAQATWRDSTDMLEPHLQVIPTRGKHTNKEAVSEVGPRPQSASPQLLELPPESLFSSGPRRHGAKTSHPFCVLFKCLTHTRCGRHERSLCIAKSVTQLQATKTCLT